MHGMRTWIVSIAYVLVSGGAGASVYEVPIFLGVDNVYGGQSILRIQGAFSNPMARQKMQIVGYDDTGTMYGPLELNAPDVELVLNSSDIENGNPEKGLPMGLGNGEGNWRLLLTTDDNQLDVRAYVRNFWGFGTTVSTHLLESAHDKQPGRPQPVHFVPMLEPRINTFQNSIVRIFNRTGHTVRVQISPHNGGAYGWCDIPAHGALTKDTPELFDLLRLDEQFPMGFQGLWGLDVRVLGEPSNPQSGFLCENGYILEGAPAGAIDDIGVMTWVADSYGNLSNVSGPPAAIVSDARIPRETTGGFDITLEFGEGFNEQWRDAVAHGAARWEQVIVADYPDRYVEISRCGNLLGRREMIDDLLIRVEWRSLPGSNPAGTQVCNAVSEGGFPAGRPNAGMLLLNPSFFNSEQVHDSARVDRVIVHEIGHVLGIGTVWDELDYLILDVDRPEFTGPKASEAFSRILPGRAESARRRGVTGVPVEDDGSHWRSSTYPVDEIDGTYTVLSDIMLPGSNGLFVTELTVGALEDLGYAVDYEQADAL